MKNIPDTFFAVSGMFFSERRPQCPICCNVSISDTVGTACGSYALHAAYHKIICLSGFFSGGLSFFRFLSRLYSFR